MRQPIKHVVRLLTAALEKGQEKRAWEMWLVQYQHMTRKNFVPFTEFYRKLTTPVHPVTNKTKDEIIEDAEMILSSLRKSIAKGR